MIGHATICPECKGTITTILHTPVKRVATCDTCGGTWTIEVAR